MSAVADTFQDSGGLAAVLEGVVRRWTEADAAAAAGKACWWQMREAGMLAVSTCAETTLVGVDISILICEHMLFVQAIALEGLAWCWCGAAARWRCVCVLLPVA